MKGVGNVFAVENSARDIAVRKNSRLIRELHLFRGGKTEIVKGKRDKGHAAEMRAFAEACRTGRQPWPFEDMVGVMRATFAIRDGVGRQR